MTLEILVLNQDLLLLQDIASFHRHSSLRIQGRGLHRCINCWEISSVKRGTPQEVIVSWDLIMIDAINFPLSDIRANLILSTVPRS